MKYRVDILLVNKNLVKSRTTASTLIKSGSVTVNGVVVQKASQEFDVDAVIEINDQNRDTVYVGRGGLKLEHALKTWNIEVADKVCLDIGASTGGFTDCLLKNGAKKVYAVDVGSGQLVNELVNNPKVVNLEKTDIRNLEKLENFENSKDDLPSLVVIDVSFISLTQVLPHAIRLSSKDAEIVTLVKPQFELDAKSLNRNGIVMDEILREKAVQKIKDEVVKLGLKIVANIQSPIKGGSGNIEYLLYLKK